MAKDHEETDVSFEPEEDLGDLGGAQAKIKKLREQLKIAEQRRDEHLIGWQRCKADSINEKRDALQAADRTVERARDAFVDELIPVLDSFDMAAAGEAWNTVSPEWRAGMRSAHC